MKTDDTEFNKESPTNMLVELILEHCLLKKNIAAWLGVSLRAVDSMLLGKGATPAIHQKLTNLYQKFNI